ncbi:MAG: TIGR03087 family PEP-CTERM/XrtA system glycosyltransferase [Pseudomonadota bacterium]
MSAKPEILLLTHRIPYPPDKGDKIRSWRLFRHLAEKFSVHLACFVDDPQDFSHTEYLRSMCASAAFIPLRPTAAKLKSMRGLLTGDPLSIQYFRSHEMLRTVDEMRARPLMAEVAFSSTMAQYISSPKPERPRIVDFCDADSEKWLQYACETTPPMAWIFHREGARLKRLENEVANWADVSFAVTPEEAGMFNRRSEIQKTVRWWSNGVDADYFDPALKMRHIGGGADVVFIGAMDYRANSEAVLRFTANVWPRVYRTLPDLTFAIVGARPTKQVHALDGRNGVMVTGRVDDVRPWLSQAKLVVAPLRVARGVQNKILEAMAMAKPVIASPEAATGLTFGDAEPLFIADNEEAMAAALIRLVNNRTERERLGKHAREAIMAHYNWQSQLQRFEGAVMPVIGLQSPPQQASYQEKHHYLAHRQA